MTDLENVNVTGHKVLITPQQMKLELPVTNAAMASVRRARQQVNAILRGDDARLLVVVGPCSIHDPVAAVDYGQRLAGLAERVADTMLLVMRVYFEKPRSTVGWKGLINDPYLNDSGKVGDGLAIARRLLIDLAELGLPLSTEALNAITPQYIQDLIAWSAIGARTSESQTHRELASGLSSAVGFKNGTDGSLEVAINAMHSVAAAHRFLGIDPAGKVAVIETSGNPHAHIVLRGGGGSTNFDADNVAACERKLRQAGLKPVIMIDCSHANSGKDPAQQPHVARCVIEQIVAGNQSIIGLMLESHLYEGRQNIPSRLEELRYGVSITDGCIDWETTEALMLEIDSSLRPTVISRVA